jgi:hypothetical protein
MKKIIPVIYLLLLPCLGFAGIGGDDEETSKSHDQIATAARLFFATKIPNANNLISPWSKNITTKLYNFTTNTASQEHSNNNISQTETQTNLINTDTSSVNKNQGEINKNILSVLNHNSVLIENHILNNDQDASPQQVFSLETQLSCNSVVTANFPSNFKIASVLEFKGVWKQQFTRIKDAEFTLTTGEKITTAFMSVNIDSCLSSHCSFTGWTIIRIPYANEYVMDIILPNTASITLTNEKQCQTIFNLLSDLSSTTKNKYKNNNVKISKATISIPLFAFQRKTLFTDTTSLYEQQCFIQVDETGTKAKATSELMLADDNFIINRPFFFAVSNIKNYNNKPLIDDIILLGTIENPTIKQ